VRSDLTGCVLSFSQLVKLLGGLSHEGLSDYFTPEAAAPLIHTERLRREYYDILASLVLFSCARVALPSYLMQQIEAESLVREGLIEFSPADEIDDFQAKITSIYHLLYEKCRSLEENRATSPLLALDHPSFGRPSKRERIDAACDRGDIDYYCSELYSRVAPLITGIQDIYGHYFNELMADTGGLFQASTERFLSDRPTFNKGFGTIWTPALGAANADINFDALFRDMGICIRDGPTLDNDIGRGTLSGSYAPSDLTGLAELSQLILGEIGRSEWIYGITLFGMRRDPMRFLYTHVFWQTLFEIVRMLKLAEASRCALFMPSTTDIRARYTHSVEVDTSADLVRIYRVYLAESGMLPRPTTFEEVLRLREDKNLHGLRNCLSRWSRNYPEIEQEPKLVTAMRKDIATASSAVSRLEGLARVGSIVGYVALPVAIAEATTGRSLGGLALAPLGPAIDTYRSLRLRKFGWINFGKQRG
jgi:hypothetical protein